MRRLTAAFAALTLLVLFSGCASYGGDAAVTTEAGSGQLSAEERAWCAFLDNSNESAARFDLIFEAGLALGINMDSVNATAAALRSQYLDQGLSEEDAILATSLDLLDDDAYVEACREAFAVHGAGG